jgi:hypothetical protein
MSAAVKRPLSEVGRVPQPGTTPAASDGTVASSVLAQELGMGMEHVMLVLVVMVVMLVLA